MIPLKIKALVCAGVALGGLTACKPDIKSGDTGIATDTMSLKIDIKDPNSKKCDFNVGDNVEVVRQSYIDYDTYNENVTLVKNDECSGWTSDSNLPNNFKWNK